MRKLKNVTIEITSACNLKCQHCGNDSGNKNNLELTKEEIFNLIDELANIGVERLGLTGGEPLLHPFLFEIIEYAKDKIPTIAIATNGYFIDEEKIKKFKYYGVKKFIISLDGTRQFHNYFRGNIYAFDYALKAIKLLIENNMEVKVRSVLTKQNQESILNLIKITNEFKIIRHEIIPMCPIGRAKLDLCLTSKEYYNFLKKALHLLKTIDTKITYQFKPVFGEQSLFEDVSLECKEKSLNYRCDAFKDSLEITSNGDVIGCSFVREVVGNIRNDSILNLWNDPKTLKIYKKIHYSVCKQNCDNELCNGGCYANKCNEIEHYCFVKRR